MKINDTNRDEIIKKYINEIFDSMDLDGLYDFVSYSIEQNLEKYSNEELETEIKDCYSHILE